MKQRERTRVDDLREAYAAGRLTLGDFEVAVEAALRLPERSAGKRPSAKEAAQRWSELTAEKAGHFATGFAAGSWLPTPEPPRP